MAVLISCLKGDITQVLGDMKKHKGSHCYPKQVMQELSDVSLEV